MSRIQQKTGIEYDALPLKDLPDLPELKSLQPDERAKLVEWWRQVRELLKRYHDYTQSTTK